MKNRYLKKQTKTIKIIGLILIIFLILMLFLKKEKYNSKLLSGARDITINVMEIVSTPFMYIKEKINILVVTNSIYKEYQTLKSDLPKIDIINNKNKSLEKEINDLKNLLKLNNLNTDYEIINASIISRNKDYWFNTITIDKGNKDNINNNTAVVTNNGLIGRIIKVNNNSSVVKLITNVDNNSKLSVGVEGANQYAHGLITSYDMKNNLLIVTGISNYDGVNINSKVITTGYGVLPSNLVIGYVKKIENDNYDISKILYVKPNQDMNNINYIAVLNKKIK